MATKADKFKTRINIYTGEFNGKVHNVLKEKNLNKRQKIQLTITKTDKKDPIT
jgi:hypothetical protein